MHHERLSVNQVVMDRSFDELNQSDRNSQNATGGEKRKGNRVKKEKVMKPAPPEDLHWLQQIGGSRVKVVKVVKPARRRDDTADVNGINSLIEEMMDVDEEVPPVKRVRSSVSKVTQPVIAAKYSVSESYSDEPVEPFRPAHKPSNTSSTKVTVSNLALSVDQEDLEELFQEFKGILKVKLNIDHKERSLGTAYALFSTRAEALKSVSVWNGVDLDDKPLQMSVEKAEKTPPNPVMKVPKRQSVFNRLISQEPTEPAKVPRKVSTSSIKLTVDNIALSVDQEDLEELFQNFKGVLKIKLDTDSKGRSRGTGYALFSTRIEALKCVDTYNRVPLDGEPMRMSVEPLDESFPKEEVRVPKRPSVFSRLSKEPPLASAFQSQDIDIKGHEGRSRDSHVLTKKKYRDPSPEDGSLSYTSDESPDHQDPPRKHVFSRLSKELPLASVFQSQDINKKGREGRSHDSHVLTKRKHRDRSPEDESLSYTSDERPDHQDPPRKHVFSRLSKGPSIASALQAQDIKNRSHKVRIRDSHVLSTTKQHRNDYTSDDIPDHQHRRRKDVFSRLSNGPPMKTALQKQDNKNGHKKRTRDLYVSPKKRYRDNSAEPGSISDDSTDNQYHHKKPYTDHHNKKENLQTSKRRRHHNHDSSPDIYGTPDRSRMSKYIDYDNPEYQERSTARRKPQYVDYDNPEYQERPKERSKPRYIDNEYQERQRERSKPRYVDYDNPEYQKRPTKSHSIPRYIDYDNPDHQEHRTRSPHNERYRERKSNPRDRSDRSRQGSKISRRGGFGGERHQTHRLTTEELDAELEEMVNPKLDTDIFGP